MGQKRVRARSKAGKVFGHPFGRSKTVPRAGLYARVSTHDQQTVPLQTGAMRDYAARRGWTIVMQVKEIGSGASQREKREILRERVRAGLAHARQNGQRLGRPLTAALHADQVRKLYYAGIAKAEIARRLQIGRTSVRRMLRERVG